MLQFPLGLLRLSSLLDGLSFIILLYFAIYEKRILGDDTCCSNPGYDSWLHIYHFSNPPLLHDGEEKLAY
jgi:hypothetical protein